jgi:DNA-binding MarR family transcriptional regulator
MELYIRNGCSQDELSRAMTTDKGLVARNIKNLEKKGLIRREQNEKDRRFKYIYLTNRALSLHETLLNVLKKWILCITEGMDQTLIEQTIQGLQIVAANASNINIENTKLDKEA